jgi:hypothetical protein
MEPVTLELVAQCLNQLRYRLPRFVHFRMKGVLKFFLANLVNSALTVIHEWIFRLSATYVNCGTMLIAIMSPVRFPMRSLDF